MKTNTIISAALLSSVLAFTACTPRDVKLGGQSGGVSGQGNTTLSKGVLDISVDDNVLVTFMAEKQIEAIEFIKVATLSADANKSQISILTSPDKEDGAKVVELTTARQSSEYAIQGLVSDPAQNVVWVPSSSKKLNVEYTKNGLLEKLTATGAGLFSEAGSESVTVALRENTYNLTVTPSETAGQLKVSLNTEGYIYITKGEMFNPSAPQGVKNMNIKLEVTLEVDQASLETADVKIINSSSKIYYPGPEKNGAAQEYTLTLNGTDLLLNVEGHCNKLIGTLNSKTGSPTSKPVAFTFSSENIQVKKWIHTLAACGKRPTVDLGRMIVPR